VIGDASAHFSSDERTWSRLIEESGYLAVSSTLRGAHGIQVSIVNLEMEPRDDVPWKYGSLKLPSLCKTHAYINFAKMKTHSHTDVSLCTKNQKGLLMLADRKAFHLGKKYGSLHENIAALGDALHPELAIIDATRALEGSGPSTQPDGQTKVRRLKLCVAGTNMLEVDNAGCKIMGIPVSEVRHLRPVDISLVAGSEALVPADPPFTRPSPEILVTDNFYVHMFETCCTSCMQSRSRMFRKIAFEPGINHQMAAFRKRHKRVDFIMGNTPKAIVNKIQARGGILVFFGNCTKKIAEEFHAIHLAGCPPHHNDAIHDLLDSKE
jgi:hypothetical protein